MLEEKKRIDYFEHLVAPDKARDFLSIFEKVLSKTPYNLVRLKVNGSDELQIQVMAERDDRSMIIEDCKKLSTLLVDFIEDSEGLMDNYVLEVSSPGLDRPLKKESDFLRNKGKQILVKTYSPINNSKTNTGTVKDFSNDTLFLENKKDTLEISLTNIAQAKLIIEF